VRKYTNYKPYKGQVPFLKDNGFMTSIFNEQWMKDIVYWKDNYVFEAKLVFDRFDYKKNWVVVDPVDNREYTMFPSEVMDLLYNGDVLKGDVTGKWTFMKRGSCYGIRYLGK
jgi:hypothetical protein